MEPSGRIRVRVYSTSASVSRWLRLVRTACMVPARLLVPNTFCAARLAVPLPLTVPPMPWEASGCPALWSFVKVGPMLPVNVTPLLNDVFWSFFTELTTWLSRLIFLSRLLATGVVPRTVASSRIMPTARPRASVSTGEYSPPSTCIGSVPRRIGSVRKSASWAEDVSSRSSLKFAAAPSYSRRGCSTESTP